MKNLSLLFIFCCATSGLNAQEIQKELKHFSKIVASPRINLILTKGDKESIRLVYDDVSKNNINIEVRHSVLRIYLDNARKVEKMSPQGTNEWASRKSMYDGASITAYVTYRDLESLEIRGNQELTCKDAIESEYFRLRAYGEMRSRSPH